MSANTAFADSISNDSTVLPMELNDLVARRMVSTYFSQRKEFLLGQSEDISCAVSAIAEDERILKATLANSDVTFLNSNIEIDGIECYDKLAKADVTEYLEIDISGEKVVETISHDVHVYLFPDDTLEIVRDEYMISRVNFVSCSYVPDELENIQAVGGSKSCVVNVARAEIGYTEEPGTRYTKYSEKYNVVGYAWCASFVSWCVDEANIPSSVIPQSAGIRVISDFFHTNQRYYYSGSNGGSTKPQAGDLIFLYGNPTVSDHIGIVTSCDGTYVYYIDGNNGGKVTSSTIRFTSSDFVGFGRPAYQTSGHSYSSSWTCDAFNHWHKCYNCHAASGKTGHSFIYNTGAKKYICSVCSYATSTLPTDS